MATAKTHGMRVKLTLFIPYDPKVPSSVGDAAAAAQKLATAAGLKQVGDDVEIEAYACTTAARK